MKIKKLLTIARKEIENEINKNGSVNNEFLKKLSTNIIANDVEFKNNYVDKENYEAGLNILSENLLYFMKRESY